MSCNNSSTVKEASEIRKSFFFWSMKYGKARTTNYHQHECANCGIESVSKLTSRSLYIPNGFREVIIRNYEKANENN